MTKSIFKMGMVLLCAVLVCLPFGNYVFAIGSPQVQTNAATNFQNNSAALNGNVSDFGGYGSATVWFQWGIDANYGNITGSVLQSYIGGFSQQIYSLSYGQIYHFRVVAQNSNGISYGQDMQFTAGQANSLPMTVNAGPNINLNFGQTTTLQGSVFSPSGGTLSYSWSCTGGSLSNYNVPQPIYTAPYPNQYNGQSTHICTLTASNSLGQSNSGSVTISVNYNNGNVGSNIYYAPTITVTPNGTGSGTGTISMTKNVRNLSSGNLSWTTTTIASPADVVQFYVSLQNSGSQTEHSVTVKDIFPVGIVYNNNLTVDGNNSAGDITQGINIGDILPGQTRAIIYQGQIGSAGNFSNGQNTITGSVSATSSDEGSASATATIYITKPSLISSATGVSTGLTNNFLFDSFFLPLLLLIVGVWLWKSDLAHWFIDQLRLK